jgi:hypothetical protein
VLRRFTLSAGLALDVAFRGDDLQVLGVGTVARTPLVLLSPFVSAGAALF